MKTLRSKTTYSLMLTLLFSSVLALTMNIVTRRAKAAPTVTVMNTNDSGAGSLRQAIADVDAGGTINFDPSVTGTIKLTTGELVISKSLTINGPGARVLSVSGENASRVILTARNITTTISGLTITKGNGIGGGGGNSGGGIRNEVDSVMTINNCAFVNNSSPLDGGGVFNFFATMTINNCTFSGNSARGGGGIGLVTVR